MKKIYFWSLLILIIVALLPQEANAQQNRTQRETSTYVTSQQAMDIGYAFMRTGSGSKSGGTQSNAVRKQAMQLVYTGRATDTLTRVVTDCYYVFSLQPKGFVIVAADDRVEPILGYSYDNDFVVTNMPAHVRSWLGGYEQQIEVVAKSNLQADPATQTKWVRLKSGQPLSTRNDVTVGPLLTTTWNQAPYYNAHCPEYAENQYCATGCVATAMAQIINYWGYPIHGRGTHSYYTDYGTLTVNYDSVAYDYANMPNALTDTSTPAEVDAVATLMYHCGVASNMQFGPGASASFEVDARAAFINFFRYSPNLSIADKGSFSNYAWKTMLRENLDANSPILYSGVGESGHSFVCDGYDNNDFFHFNLGWGGANDGWYLTNAVNVGNSNYNSSQTALVGIVPDSTGHIILGQMDGTSIFTVDEPLEFYHLMGHNAYRGIDHFNMCDNMVYFIPADTTSHMVLDILSYEYQNVTIYDSIQGNQLRTLQSYSNNDFSPVVSTASALTIWYQGNAYYSGFNLNVSRDNGCRMVSNIEWSVDTNTIHLAWHENGNATQWQVEYDLKGFTHGNGTMITVNDTTIDIGGLFPFKEYDMYIRSVCGMDQYGPWRMVAVMPEAHYWVDIVTSQPDGFVEDSLGNITISSAEGLAWYAHKTLESNYYGKHVTLTADIDLSQYKWKPMRLDNGVFDGAGHTIENMFIIEHNASYMRSLGLFGDVMTKGIIKNVTLNNIYISSYFGNSGYGNVGGLVGDLIAGDDRDSIINCWVQGKIEGGDMAGGIVGRTYNADIINSASLCDVTSKIAGGIVGMTDRNSALRNCYMGGAVIPTAHGTWYGTIVAVAYGGLIHDCFYKKQSRAFDVIGYNEYCDYSHIIQYQFNNGNWLLDEPAVYDDVSYYNLVDVLNKGVEFVNISGLKTWQNDDANINNGLPVFGEEYIVTCPNISNLCLRNIVQDNNHGVVVSWDENGNAEQWQIRYRLQDSTEYSVYITSQNLDTLWNLAFGENYRFSIRPICDETHHGAWTDDVVFAVNTPYWTETVVSQPAGYAVDSNGNITIFTSEGLAWLISVVNGLNGQEPNSLESKLVLLASDVDMSNLRWVSINGFSGRFDGDNHVISGINIAEQSNNQGFFGAIENANVVNVSMQNVTVTAFENVGGLCGFSQRSSFDNCNVTGIINGRKNVGGLIGEMDNSSVQHCCTQGSVISSYYGAGGLVGVVRTHLSYVDESLLPVNCYVGNSCSSCEVMADFNGTGGLIGNVDASLGNIMIENSYSRNTISGFIYVGGLIGSVTGLYSNIVTIRNCCSYSNVEAYPWYVNSVYPDEWLNGAFIGQCTGSVRLSRCYMIPNGDLQFIGSHHGTFDGFSMSDTSFFSIVDNAAILNNPITINAITYNQVEEVLNAWVDLYADVEYKTWMVDSGDEYRGMPVFGDLFVETCSAIASISVDSVWNNGVRLRWHNNDSVSLWKVEYGIHGFEKGYGNSLFVSDTIINIQPLITGCYYDFYVQAVCGDNGLGRCDSILTVKPDKKYWKDVVTMRPDGYQEDADGNVYISSAEGLAWLISTGNGLNGENRNFFYNKKINLTQNVDMSNYRWTEIQNFMGELDGHNHIITGLYINENDDYHAMFRSMSEGSCIKNIIIRNGNVRGLNNVAGLCIYQYGTIENCGVECNVYSNKFAGVISTFNNGNIINSYANGYIYGTDHIGGAIGWNSGTIQNCYAATFLESSMLSLRDMASGSFGQFAGQDFVYDNSNIAYWANTPFNITNTIRATNNSEIGYFSFYGSDTIWMLTNPQIINGYSYVSLTDVLNAWVDANNIDGKYYHWVTDTAMVNGGFPVFAAIPCPEIDVHDTIVVCDSYTWYGTVFTSDTLLTDTLSTLAGCDSVVTHHIIVNHPVYTTFSETACESYEWNGEAYTTSGDYDQTFTAANGCDSIVTLHLTVNYSTTGDTIAVVCGSFEWYGMHLIQSGEYTHTLTNVAGCDSVVTLHLTINTATNGDTNVTVCGSYDWYEMHLTQSGDYTLTLTTTAGCDSVVTLHLTINQPTTSIDVQTACGSYNWIDGVTYTESNNTATYTLTNAVGCDSIVTLNLTINQPNTGVDVQTACGSYNWIDGVTYTESNNTATYTLTNAVGCDSVVTLNLTINQPTTGTDVQTACGSYTWIDGVTYTESNNTATYTLTNAVGCDSVVTLNLTINQPTTSTDVQTACGSFTWIDGITYTESNNSATYTLTNAVGCDSIVNLNLTINQPTTVTDMQTACGSYTWIDGITYTESNSTATYTLTNMAGCDSVVTLNLTINQPTTGTDVQTACGSYTWIDGITYTESNCTATYMLTNAVGCDSIVTLNLTINQPTTGIDAQTACGNYTWIDGITYTENNNTATYTLTNAVGCDSVVTLNLTINQPVTSTSTATICDSELPYEWNGLTFNEVGTQSLTLQAVNGCDSTVEMTLTVNPTVTIEACLTINENDLPFTYGDTTFMPGTVQSGDYVFNFTTIDGCDSIIILHLTVETGISGYDLSANMKVYPNPTSGVLNVELTTNNVQFGDVKIQIYDVYGKLLDNVETQNVASPHTTQINLSRYSSGVYFIKAVDGDRQLGVRKIVKQ
jgi:hypothetical protein